MDMAQVLIRYYDPNGNQVYEQITDKPWDPENVFDEKQGLLRVGPPVDMEIVSAEIVPAVMFGGEEFAVDELEALLPKIDPEDAQRAQFLVAALKDQNVFVTWN